MSDLTINYFNAKTKQEAMNLAKEAITPEYIAKFKVKAQIDFNQSAGTIIAQGKGFTLSLSFSEYDCKVDIKLSFLLRALKGTILDKVESKVKRTL